MTILHYLCRTSRIVYPFMVEPRIADKSGLIRRGLGPPEAIRLHTYAGIPRIEKAIFFNLASNVPENLSGTILTSTSIAFRFVHSRWCDGELW